MNTAVLFSLKENRSHRNGVSGNPDATSPRPHSLFSSPQRSSDSAPAGPTARASEGNSPPLGGEEGDGIAMLFFKKLFARTTTPASSALPTEDLRPLGDGRYRNKIMVVDDDPVVLKAVSMTLQSKGYKVVTATDGPQAIGLMRDVGADIMLMDVSFPAETNSWDGFRLAQWIRYMNRGLPTIMISGSYKPEYETRAAAMGAEAFMIKPLDKKRLLGAISKALGTTSTVPTLKRVEGL